MAVSATTHMSLFQEMGNLVMFGPKVNANTLLEWCGSHCNGAFLFARHPMTLFSGAKQPTVGAFSMPASRVEINTSGFSILFETPDDIMRLKLAFDWADLSPEISK